ncbi:DegT/DnrJ/EryC1/StrS family aminotransferase [Brevundimonas aveniformis]|mgnify:CR=1 FL=1|uniref:DegT/DnrJ/EryC1/StrS family aminotransferase n=1 Tax=Brevundimonas aveniformis TaxID=370977 RepID=UPI000420A733|nr:DegT/DnrJ/EryC1/StrS family aminotransferase [Brevundimonas aveniformis]
MNLFNTTVTDAAIAKVNEVLRSTFLNEGEVVREFEASLRSAVGAPHVATVNSCTAALHLCLEVLGVGPGDEVIVPPQTFIATGLVVLHAGGTPVFADIDPDTGNISAASIRDKITDRTKAVIAVHWGGAPVDLDAVQAVCRDAGVPLIEDAAHAFGARWKGQPIGALSRFTCFSFQAIKGMTTGDGGAIACLDDDDATHVYTRRWFGIDKRKVTANDIGERSALIEQLGYKYHMNNVAAALGVGNLPSYPERLARRREIDKRYRQVLGQSPDVRLLQPLEGAESSCWLFGLRLERREDFGRAMKGRGVPVSVIDRRIDRHPVFGGLTAGLTGAEVFDAEHIAIPLHDGLSDDDVEQVTAAVLAGW